MSTLFTSNGNVSTLTFTATSREGISVIEIDSQGCFNMLDDSQLPKDTYGVGKPWLAGNIMARADEAAMSDLIGVTLSAVVQFGEALMLFCADGRVFDLEHQQNCCEEVWLEDVTGDLADLIGSPVLLAEESIVTRDDAPEGEWSTASFYKLATRKGYVDLRFNGFSNGNYAEKAELVLLKTRVELL